MHPFLKELSRGLHRSGLKATPVILGVSGGADSMALLRGMLESRSEFDLTLHVAHLNHRLRGAAADDDADWLRRTCQDLAVSVIVGEVDVAKRAESAGCGVEEAARAARYEFLAQAAATHAAAAIAVAHSADDQVETILHHLVRGTGLAGLRGMPCVRDLDAGLRLFRPMLSIRREVIRGYLSDIGQEFREDGSNVDESHTRNRIRRSLLPLLAAEYNPGISDALLRLSLQASEAYAAVEALATELLETAWESHDPASCRLNCQLLGGRPRHLLREMFALAWRRHDWPRQKMTFEHWDQLVALALHGGAASLPGNIDARRSGNVLVLTRK